MQNSAPFDVTGIEKNIQKFEETTGYELIVAAAQSSDPYPGAAWRGGVLIGLLIAGLVFHHYEIHPRSFEILATGVLIVAAVWGLRLSGLYRYFVMRGEAERETTEKAAEMFSHFQSQNLGHQASILMFFSLNEHKIHLLVDSELKDKLPQQDLNEIVALMAVHFKQGNYSTGLEASVATLEQKVLAKAGKRTSQAENHVANKVFWFS